MCHSVGGREGRVSLVSCSFWEGVGYLWFHVPSGGVGYLEGIGYTPGYTTSLKLPKGAVCILLELYKRRSETLSLSRVYQVQRFTFNSFCRNLAKHFRRSFVKLTLKKLNRSLI